MKISCKDWNDGWEKLNNPTLQGLWALWCFSCDDLVLGSRGTDEDISPEHGCRDCCIWNTRAKCFPTAFSTAFGLFITKVSSAVIIYVIQFNDHPVSKENKKDDNKLIHCSSQCPIDLSGKRTTKSSMGSEDNDTELDRKNRTRRKTGLNQSFPLLSLKSIPTSSKYLLPIASKWNSQGYSGCTVEVAKETGFTYDFTCWLFHSLFLHPHIL